MEFSLATIAYREARFLKPFLGHIPWWVDMKLVLISSKPWFGEELSDDGTFSIAQKKKAVPMANYWPNEESQRNTGQDLLSESDWIIILDPDEFLSKADWEQLRKFLETTDSDAVVCKGQYTYWKDGWVAEPPRDYQQLIAVRPHVRFIDKRVVNTSYVVAPVWVHHFSWARTDQEVWNKITHYAHANDFDTKKWFNEVWATWQPGDKDVHPTTPDTLHDFKLARLPKELRGLGLWP